MFTQLSKYYFMNIHCVSDIILGSQESSDWQDSVIPGMQTFTFSHFGKRNDAPRRIIHSTWTWKHLGTFYREGTTWAKWSSYSPVVIKPSSHNQLRLTLCFGSHLQVVIHCWKKSKCEFRLRHRVNSENRWEWSFEPEWKSGQREE